MDTPKKELPHTRRFIQLPKETREEPHQQMRALDIGMQLDKKARDESPLLVPLHTNYGVSSLREARMIDTARIANAHRMFELSRGRGWRVNGDGTAPYLLHLAGDDGKPEQSKRSQKKRLEQGLFLQRCKDNPKQNWSNYQRNHNGRTRNESHSTVA